MAIALTFVAYSKMGASSIIRDGLTLHLHEAVNQGNLEEIKNNIPLGSNLEIRYRSDDA